MKRARLDCTEWLANRIASSTFNAPASEPGHFLCQRVPTGCVPGHREFASQARFRSRSCPWQRGLSGGRLTNYRSRYVIVRLTNNRSQCVIVRLTQNRSGYVVVRLTNNRSRYVIVRLTYFRTELSAILLRRNLYSARLCLAIAMIWQHLRLTKRRLCERRLEMQMRYDRRLSQECAHAVAAISPAASI
jgi:hypothetical protein